MTRRTFEEADAALREVTDLLGYGPDCREEWEAGHGLTGVMVHEPGCTVSRLRHSGKGARKCGCLGPVTGVGRYHATVLLASMCLPPLCETPVADKPVMGWNHVTTWTDNTVQIPTAKQVRYRR